MSRQKLGTRFTRLLGWEHRPKWVRPIRTIGLHRDTHHGRTIRSWWSADSNLFLGRAIHISCRRPPMAVQLLSSGIFRGADLITVIGFRVSH